MPFFARCLQRSQCHPVNLLMIHGAKTHFQSKFRAPWVFTGQNSNKRHFAHRWCKTPGENAFQRLSSGGIFRLMESFQDLSLEDVFLKLNLNWSVFLQLGVRIAWNCGAFHWEFQNCGAQNSKCTACGWSSDLNFELHGFRLQILYVLSETLELRTRHRWSSGAFFNRTPRSQNHGSYS